MIDPSRLIAMVYESDGDIRLGDKHGQVLVTSDLDPVLRRTLRRNEAAIAHHLATSVIEAETTATATVLEVFAGARDVTSVQPTSEVVTGLRLADAWNHTPEPGDPGSPYCGCGRRAVVDDEQPTCQIHRSQYGRRGQVDA